MVKQVIAGPIQAILAILGSRLLLNTQNVVVKTFHRQSGAGTESQDTRATMSLMRFELKEEERMELSWFTETIVSECSEGGRDV